MLCLSGFELYSRWLPLKNRKGSTSKCKNEKEKVRKNNARINEKKKRKKRENYTQALGELKCGPYTKKKWLKFRIEQSSTRGILNFRAKGIKYFGDGKWTVIRVTSNLPPIYGTLLKPHQNEAAKQTSSLMKGSGWTQKALLKLSTNCWCWRIFFCWIM